jgi:hypothetical protein
MTNSPDRRGASGMIAALTNSAAGARDELARARSEALNVVQWLACVAQSYVTSGPPKRHTDLDFRAESPAFVTKPFADGIALEMRLPRLHLQFLQNDEPVPHVFDPQERSPAEAEAWILVELLHRGIDREKFCKKLPYAVPGLLTGDAEDYAPEACTEGLAQLTALFGKADSVLTAAARASGAEQPTIIGLPQTLDLVLTSLPGAKAIALGFSPGNAQNPEPHFYAVEAANAALAMPARAIVRGSELLAEDDAARAAVRLLKIAAA